MAILVALGPLNVNEGRSRKSALILNHLAMSFCFGSMFVDTIKMVFVAAKLDPINDSVENN